MTKAKYRNTISVVIEKYIDLGETNKIEQDYELGLQNVHLLSRYLEDNPTLLVAVAVDLLNHYQNPNASRQLLMGGIINCEFTQIDAAVSKVISANSCVELKNIWLQTTSTYGLWR